MSEAELIGRIADDRQRRLDSEKARGLPGPSALLLPFALALSRLVARLDAAEAQR